MQVHLADRWIQHLCRLPETGMGYHVVDVVLRNGQRVRNILVYNSEHMEWPSNKDPIRTDDILELRRPGS